MPYISLRVAGKLTQEQKQKIAASFAQTMLDVCNKPKESTYLVIDEVERENWAKGDKFLA
ncbi:MAG: 4-oxalocrotonate tautomerase family protein [Candidatus Omnitrophica bacterium]|nr:4-oxalocrotonate tautomerase family protein [Candidatus Omnitrophota bacterium]MCB9721866.1 4-oxalocrotonate tautomerase family protein [Candidatus Omnitrophota bacterium]